MLSLHWLWCCIPTSSPPLLSKQLMSGIDSQALTTTKISRFTAHPLLQVHICINWSTTYNLVNRPTLLFWLLCFAWNAVVTLFSASLNPIAPSHRQKQDYGVALEFSFIIWYNIWSFFSISPLSRFWLYYWSGSRWFGKKKRQEESPEKKKSSPEDRENKAEDTRRPLVIYLF